MIELTSLIAGAVVARSFVTSGSSVSLTTSTGGTRTTSISRRYARLSAASSASDSTTASSRFRPSARRRSSEARRSFGSATATRTPLSSRKRTGGAPGGAIGAGLCVLLGIAAGDDEAAAERLAGKIARLRVFEGADGKFDRSLLDTGGAALVVSQFTLIADTRKGNRPSFAEAARPERAEPLYERFCAALRELGVEVAQGRLRRTDGARACERGTGD